MLFPCPCEMELEREHIHIYIKIIHIFFKINKVTDNRNERMDDFLIAETYILRHLNLFEDPLKILFLSPVNFMRFIVVARCL